MLVTYHHRLLKGVLGTTQRQQKVQSLEKAISNTQAAALCQTIKKLQPHYKSVFLLCRIDEILHGDLNHTCWWASMALGNWLFFAKCPTNVSQQNR